ncbi:MAG: hypothetical protein D6696_14115 [Acidobacteria bacterium]|nr:MAG: hypothetical protein D6696_14115 [Acidobacteriota bacterium]
MASAGAAAGRDLDHALAAAILGPANARRAATLLADFWPRRRYDRACAEHLIGLARGGAGDAWEVRRLAALMLQAHVLLAPADDLAAHDHLLGRLGLKAPGLDRPLDDEVLREGYDAVELEPFVRQFRRRLRRHRPLFRRLPDGDARADFLHLSTHDCRLALARYLFDPAEVVARIDALVRRTAGIAERSLGLHCEGDREIRHALARLPRYEAEILRRLAAGAIVRWAGARTPLTLYALVEYPLGTVVLVVKPPGSELELQIKRAGRPGRQPLNVVFARDNARVPGPHRLDGGSTVSSLAWDARAAAHLDHVHRRVHGRAAPLARTFAISAIDRVPARGGSVHLLDYFTQRRVFGPGYDAMRRALARSLAAFKEELDRRPALELPGELGETLQFLDMGLPGQAILAGTSSLRLDKLAEYLSPGGAGSYFEEGLGRRPTAGEARRFADDLLAEVLGEYESPAVDYHDHGRYLEAAFAVPANRARADAASLSLARQIGRFWGTLLGLFGYSHGESFVGRNVGLRSIWQEGRWRVRMIFMDHDNLHEFPLSWPELRPSAAALGMLRDERHIFGHPKIDPPAGELGHLGAIYRPGGDLAARLPAILRSTAAEAFAASHRWALERSGKVRRERRTQLAAWRAVVRSYFDHGGAGGDRDGWRDAGRALLAEHGHDPVYVERTLRETERYAVFWAQNPFLYRFEDRP